jgi:fatty acid desaturase
MASRRIADVDVEHRREVEAPSADTPRQDVPMRHRSHGDLSAISRWIAALALAALGTWLSFIAEDGGSVATGVVAIATLLVAAFSLVPLFATCSNHTDESPGRGCISAPERFSDGSARFP